jgi:hypothetical protein
MERTIAELTALLVAHGRHRVDFNGADAAFGNGDWTVHECCEHHAILEIGMESGSIGVLFNRQSGLLCSMEVIDDGGGTLLRVGWWPGLRAAWQFHLMANLRWDERLEQVTKWDEAGLPYWAEVLND